LIGVRIAKNKKLVGIIFGSPISLNIRDTIIDAIDTKFMIVHTKFSKKRLSCILINEFRRRAVSIHNYKYGHFVTTQQVAKPVSLTTRWISQLDLIDPAFINKKPMVVGTEREMTAKDSFPVM
jgi:glycylpeptide N-tetradecanoyltransferase